MGDLQGFRKMTKSSLEASWPLGFSVALCKSGEPNFNIEPLTLSYGL